jgi:hypothetical protein
VDYGEITQVARQIFDRYLAPEVEGKYVPGVSIFDPRFAEHQRDYEDQIQKALANTIEAARASMVGATGSAFDPTSAPNSIYATLSSANTAADRGSEIKPTRLKPIEENAASGTVTPDDSLADFRLRRLSTFNSQNTNVLGVYGSKVQVGVGHCVSTIRFHPSVPRIVVVGCLSHSSVALLI